MKPFPAHFSELRPELSADFIERVPEVSGSTDREATLAQLQGFHQKAVEALGFSWDQLYRAEQVHDRRVALINASQSPRVAPKADALITPKADALITPKADALITMTPGLLLGIYVADCAAVYLMDESNGALGLVHSGKRGTELRIVPETLQAMRDAFGSRPEQIHVHISPCIRPPHYETDIAAEIRRQALESGVLATHLSDCGEDTASHLDRFYSYRMEQGATGRMLALLGRRA